MVTLEQNDRAVGSTAYFGDKRHWLIVCAVHRDSGCIDRSNFECAQKDLEKLIPADWPGDESPLQVQEYSHWAVGWVQYLTIDPTCAPLVARGEELRSSLEDYPVLDDMHLSELEHTEANQIWERCYNVKDRVAYIRKHRSQFEFRDWQDMIGCVRGQYFCGYDSELISH